MSGEPPRHGIEDVPFRFRTPIEIRFRDLDALGHVNNAVYFTYFEIARSAYFKAVHGRQYNVEDFAIVLTEASCHYRSPAFFGEPLIAEVATIAIRSRSFELRYRILAGETRRLVAEGRSVQLAYDHRTKRTIALSPTFRREVEAFEGRKIGSAATGTSGRDGSDSMK